ncbi:MAG: grasp-with-spasm system ATP-grasp peptide maturase [Lewinellaceae bacterium]|nr:grasp-with-spasm system ATP-grasp peptide maturase [Lewinellaceae bacterium]
MILILSSATDQSTSKVIDWLAHRGVRFLRLNGEQCYLSSILFIDPGGQMSIKLTNAKGRIVCLNDFTAFWYRRGDFFPARPKISRYRRQVFGILAREWEKISEAFHFYLEQKPHLGCIRQDKNHNKIIALLVAAEAGLSIPATLITSDKPELLKFIEQDSAITKAVWNLFRIHGRNFFRSVGTHLVTRGHIATLEAVVAPTLVQREIPKAYELRVFILGEDCYPMAIFSQNDPKTRLDFRNYNHECPNRGVPYLLPEDIKQKLLRFMQNMELDTGSIDLIVTPGGEFVFLEVNPIGQFGWVSDNCNYYLEEKIASYLEKLKT